MSVAAKFRLEINRGTTFNASFVPAVEDDASPPVRIASDLTGSSFTLKFRDDARTMQYPYPFRSLKDGYPLTVEDGRILIQLPPEFTASLQTHKRYYYLVDWHHPSGDVTRLIEGPATVRPS